MTISSAIQDRHLLSFTYDGFPRVVEPHCCGTDKKGHPALRAYQVQGGSESGEYVGWKLFHFILDVASGRKKTFSDQWGLHNQLAVFNPAPVT